MAQMTTPKRRRTKRAWQKLRRFLVRNPTALSAIAAFVGAYLRFVRATNRMVRDDGPDTEALMADQGAMIFTCWHGQHFMFPYLTRKGEPSAMMVSRSADAELNARIVEKAGIAAIRGSGGRDAVSDRGRGGARALIALRNHLRDGRSAALIADIPKGTPREAGMGIITLAKISGVPIVPVAYATSRRHIFRRAWDQAALHLPFGRAALVVGKPVRVAADADSDAMEKARLELQSRLNEVTADAYAAVDA